MYNIIDTRNVIDRFKGMENDSIRSELRKTAFPYAVCMQHISGDFNLGTVLRNANAFNALEAFYFGGRRHWDRRSSLGVQNYTDFTHLKTIEELSFLKSKYTFIGIDNIPGSIKMSKFDWPNNILMIFGEEGQGLIPEIIEMCESIVCIEQFGSVRSVNVGTASGIVMNDFVTKYNRKNNGI